MIELHRVGLWRKRFENAIDSIKNEPFVWGKNDCVIGLCNTVVKAITDVNCGEEYIGKYDSPESGYKLMKAEGFKNLGDMVASIIPEYPEGPSRAKIGDIVAIPEDTRFGFALGVVNGERVFVLKPGSMGTVDLLDATRAYKVG